jgi:hypothetical protein
MIEVTNRATEHSIRDTVRGLAIEIGKRVEATQGLTQGHVAQVEAEAVLLDWFLGDFIPGSKA